MSIREELERGTITSCKLCRYIGGLTPAVAAEWEESLALPITTVSNTVVAEALGRRGVKVDEASVRRHRRNHVPKGS